MNLIKTQEIILLTNKLILTTIKQRQHSYIYKIMQYLYKHKPNKCFPKIL